MQTETRTPEHLRELAFERRAEADRAHADGCAELGDRLDREARELDREALRAEVADLLLRALAALGEADLPQLGAARSGLLGLGGRLPGNSRPPASPRALALARALADLGDDVAGLVVSRRGWPLTLSPADEGWAATYHTDVPGDTVPATAPAGGSTARAALDRCADELDAAESDDGCYLEAVGA